MFCWTLKMIEVICHLLRVTFTYLLKRNFS